MVLLQYFSLLLIIHCIVISFTTFAAVTNSTNNATCNNTSKWKQERFVLSFWVDPIVPIAEFPEKYAEIKAANFTMILGGFGAKTPAAIEAQIMAAEDQGLGVIVAAGTNINTSVLSNSSSPSLWGYMIKDEPRVKEFASLGVLVNKIAIARPGKLSFLNLLPNYGGPHEWGTTTYAEYVDGFIQNVKPDVLCVDNYPYFTKPDYVPGTNRTRAGYRVNLAVMRTASLKAGIPFWNFFNVMPFGSHADPSEAQISWQIFTSLAYGAKGLLYFSYWTPVSSEFPLGGGIITPINQSSNYVKGPKYDQVSRFNTHVLAYEQHLISAVSTGVWHVVTPADGGSSSNQLIGCIISDLHSHIPTAHFLVGQFRLADGRVSTLLNNHDDQFNVWATLSFKNSSNLVFEVSPISGEETLVQDDSPRIDGLQLAIQAGSGRLLVFGHK